MSWPGSRGSDVRKVFVWCVSGVCGVEACCGWPLAVAWWLGLAGGAERADLVKRVAEAVFLDFQVIP